MELHTQGRERRRAAQHVARLRTHLGTEFGRALFDLVASVPGALGALLSDAHGDAVDFAHHADRVTALDVQLTGPQVQHSLLHLQNDLARHQLGRGVMVVRAERGGLIAAAFDSVVGSLVLTLWLAPHTELDGALLAFDKTLLRIHAALASAA